MALVNCHECGNEISTESKTCPKCGAKNKQFKRSRLILLGGGFLLFFGLLIAYQVYEPYLNPSIPTCDSSHGGKIFIDTFDSSPYALGNHLRVIDIKSYKDISKSENPEDRRCEITFRLSNAKNMTYIFSFEEKENGGYFIRGKPK